MNEIYWITRFDYIYGVARVLLILSIITIMVLLMRCIAETDSIDEFVENIKKYIKIFRVTICVMVLGTLMLVFVPNTKDAFVIYGLGGTIDYIESNKTAQGLPDKFIQAVDKYLDNEIKDEKEDKE